ncbi:hypothetical protein JUNP514_4033 (plasmid) [Acinetobacter baumannii]
MILEPSCQFQFTKRQFYKISIKYIQYSKELCDKFTNQCCDKTKKITLNYATKIATANVQTNTSVYFVDV